MNFVARTWIACVLALASCRVEPEVEPKTRVEPLDPNSIQAAGAYFDLRIPVDTFALGRAELEVWVRDAARAVQSFYGRMPVERVTIELQRTAGRGVGGGETRGYHDHAMIWVVLGERADARDLARDWVLTHEMVHLAMPALPEPNHWFEEGVATYIEPIARARVGLESARDVWRQLVDGLPNGLPSKDDPGLDGTTSWGRTYWGGALFCLLADISIRERTDNRLGLEDALRAIVTSGRSIRDTSTMERLLAEFEDAVGVTAVTELYARHGPRAEATDLAALWKKLGVAVRRHRIVFDDTAPLAAIRRAITGVEE